MTEYRYWCEWGREKCVTVTTQQKKKCTRKFLLKSAEFTRAIYANQRFDVVANCKLLSSDSMLFRCHLVQVRDVQSLHSWWHDPSRAASAQATRHRDFVLCLRSLECRMQSSRWKRDWAFVSSRASSSWRFVVPKARKRERKTWIICVRHSKNVTRDVSHKRCECGNRMTIQLVIFFNFSSTYIVEEINFHVGIR